MRSFLAGLILAGALVAGVSMPSMARAGGCTPCTTSAECVAMFGAPAYCVRFDRDTGCGELRQYCCPGQGCAAGPEGPMCTGCVEVGGDTDAGMEPVEDAGGIPAFDAGPPADGGNIDAGPRDGGGGADAGGGTDAGRADGGGGGGGDGGCGCAAVTPAGAATAWLGFAVLSFWLLRRRRG